MTEHDDNKLIAERRSKLAELRESGRVFPNDFRRDSLAAELDRDYGERERDAFETLDRRVAVAGRIMAKRGPFLVLQDGSGQIQLYVDRKTLPEALFEASKHWDIGDIVGARGPLRKSGKGSLYVYIEQAELLTKALRPLPEKYHGLADQELRYRQRYVDLIVNGDTRRTFHIRSATIRYLRRFFDERGFLEVETPMMQPIPGGAVARPFVTHHNALDMDLYLRIAPELYLKRLVVGGFERVYEINRNFRNEGLSTRHNPEFTMLEFYQAYADHHELMDLSETLLRGLVRDVLGTEQVHYQDVMLDFSAPFERLSVVEAVLRHNPDIDPVALDDLQSARAVAERMHVAVPEGADLGGVQLALFEETVEHRLQQPIFITAFPTEVSPLSRPNDLNSEIADRFELFIAGREIANGFSELNDPEDQAERFRAQVAARDAGDVEAMYYDADYIRALEYGMPPTAGEGIGIDRLVMLLTDAPSIRDVILFPHLRPEAASR